MVNLLEKFKRYVTRDAGSSQSKPPYDTNQSEAVYNSLMEGLESMKSKGVDRIPLLIGETKPSENIGGRWISSDENIYYPFGVLTDEEQKMVLDKKTYIIFSLVDSNVGDMVRYQDKGVEGYKRNHTTPFLSRLMPESRLNYVNEGNFYSTDDLRELSQHLVDFGLTPEIVKQKIEKGIQEYREKTIELDTKVKYALDGMEARGKTSKELCAEYGKPAEDLIRGNRGLTQEEVIFSEMRKKIEAARKGNPAPFELGEKIRYENCDNEGRQIIYDVTVVRSSDATDDYSRKTGTRYDLQIDNVLQFPISNNLVGSQFPFVVFDKGVEERHKDKYDKINSSGTAERIDN